MQIWVSRQWTGPDNCDGHVWGIDAFSTIQEGISAVEAGGTVRVTVGLYEERLTIPKSLTLLGPWTGVTPNAGTTEDPYAANLARGSRETEAVIVAPTYDVTLPGGIIVTIAADNVTISGFTIDGDNPLQSGGMSLNEADVNAAVGIGNQGGHFQGILITHNILRNFAMDALHFENATVIPQMTGSSAILYNRIDNCPKNSWPEHPEHMPPIWGMGIRIVREFYRVAYNTITRVACGMDLRYIPSTDSTATPLVTGNRIAASNAGIQLFLLHDRQRRAGPEALVDQNIVTITSRRDSETAFPTAALTISYIEHNAKVLATNNQLRGGDVGIFLWEIPTYNQTNVTIANTTITDAGYGVWMMNYYAHGQWGIARASGVLLSGVTITNPLRAGIYLEDNAPAHIPLTVTAANACVIDGGPVGLRLQGPNTVLQGNGGAAASLRLLGQTQQAIIAEDGASLPTLSAQ